MAEAILNVIAIIALVLIGGFIVYLLAELILSVDGKRGTLLFRNRKNTDRDNEILLEYNKNHETNDSFYLPNEKSKDLMLDFDKQYEHANEADLQTNNINMLRADEEKKLLEAKQKAEGEIKAEEAASSQPETQVYDDFVYVNGENPNKFEEEKTEPVVEETKPETTKAEDDDDDDQSIEEILASIQERNRNNRNRFVADLNEDEEDETPFETETESEEKSDKDERLDAQEREIERLNSMILELKEQIENKDAVTPEEITSVVEEQPQEEVAEESNQEEVVEEPVVEEPVAEETKVVEEPEVVAEETTEEPTVVEKIVEVQDTAEIERLNNIINELNAKVEAEQAKNAELVKQAEQAQAQNAEEEITEATLEAYEAKLAELVERQKINDKDLRLNKKEYIPLARIEKTLESDKNKLRRKEAIVAKKKIVLFGVNNYVADPEKEKKLAEDLDLLEGLKLSVQHCEEVMNNNKDRYPVLKHANEILTRNAVEIQEDIDEINGKIAHAKEVLGINDGGEQ